MARPWMAPTRYAVALAACILAPSPCFTIAQLAVNQPEDSAASVQAFAASLEKMAIDSRGDQAVARKLEETYHKLALICKADGQDRLAREASDRAKLVVDEFVSGQTLKTLVDLIQQRDAWAVTAANRLGELGAAAAPAVPALDVALNDGTQDHLFWKLQPAAAKALGEIGPAAAQVLLKAAGGADSSLRRIAVNALGVLEQHPVEAARAIRDSLKDKEPGVRRACVLALVRLTEEEGVLDAIQASIKDSDTSVQQAAIFVLGSNGLKSKPAIPALLNAIHDPDPLVSRAAIVALGRVGTGTDTIVAALIEVIRSGDDSQKNSALAALGIVGPEAKTALPVVVTALTDDNRNVQSIARQTLRRIDPAFAVTQLGPPFDAVAENQRDRSALNVGPRDWPQWGGSRQRNNTPPGENIPIAWDVKSGKNIKWTVKLGSESYGNPCVANGKVFIGTNNGHGYLQRFPSSVDLGTMLCLDEASGTFLWQYSSPKLPAGRVHDWPQQGMPSTPVADGNRLWVTTNRCEIACLDADGFHDQENDGPFREEANENLDEADIVWRFDMMKELGVSPHNMSNCSILMADGILFVCTSNGVDDSQVTIPAPDAPSFIAMDCTTGKVLWTDNSPGRNILHAQWASASYGVFGGQPQVLFPGGDGWLYSFDPAGDGQGHSKMLWKFDCNPKDSIYVRGGPATRNPIIAFACIYDDLVYLTVGDDPEHGEGEGRLWCIDPGRKMDGSDVSPELVVDIEGKAVPQRRLCAVDLSAGESVISNPVSAVVWQFSSFDANVDGEIDFEEVFHRSISTPVIKDDVLYIADFSGLFHCLNAKTGEIHWSYDQFAAAWGSALVVDDKVYVGDEDGDVAIFRHSPNTLIDPAQGTPVAEINMDTSIFSTPVVANNVLFLVCRNAMYAIEETELPK
jgi:HEAT repeat protein/outer membrane protein assembly factor BamB